MLVRQKLLLISRAKALALTQWVVPLALLERRCLFHSCVKLLALLPVL
jgi:hypothetical protein